MTATPTTLQDPHGRPQPTPPNRRARAVMPLAMALPVAAAAAVKWRIAFSAPAHSVTSVIMNR